MKERSESVLRDNMCSHRSTSHDELINQCIGKIDVHRKCLPARGRPARLGWCGLYCIGVLNLSFSVCLEGITTSVSPWHTGHIPLRGGGGDLLDESLPRFTSEWRDDVGQRYSELKPPARKRSSAPQPMLKGDLLRKLSEESVKALDGSRHLEDGCIMLDLDKTCLFGNDGNDLGIALQWMEKPIEDVQALYQHLVNPALRPAYDQFRRQVKNAKVVIYTMRSSLLFYNSNFRGLQIPVQFAAEWHKDGQLYLPAEIKTADEIMQRYSGPPLIEEEHTDMQHAMERLLAARDAVAKSLDLPEGSVIVVVTSSHKEVARTAVSIGARPASAYLWDDNPKLTGCAGVVPVPPYVALDASRRAELLRFLEAKIPAHELDADLIDFMASAPPDETVLSCDHIGLATWVLPEAEAPPRPWPVPELRRYAGADGGSMSPVTPSDGLEEDAGLADGRRLLTNRIATR
uniref:Uncharacterized protein n=1 Tax=Cryptomonas curvata TaxID=233186 RepID=A0A7S0QN91_9CRYP|mmetsp:Transcript_38060/g.79741  ORF Transcript_38060/g.79741 Transcript_38060/m.79741 type:complete len:460 (+) Transcript_38060:30-1409(+)